MSAARDDLLNQAEDLLRAARAAGADVAETSMSIGTSLSLQRRLGKVEETERAEGRGMSLRVFIGKQNASVSAGSIDPAAFARLAEQAVAMARVVPEDIYAEIPEAPPPIDAGFLDLNDPAEPSMEILISRAAAAEDAAMSLPGITNSEGASAGWGGATVSAPGSCGGWPAARSSWCRGWPRTGLGPLRPLAPDAPQRRPVPVSWIVWTPLLSSAVKV